MIDHQRKRFTTPKRSYVKLSATLGLTSTLIIVLFYINPCIFSSQPQLAECVFLGSITLTLLSLYFGLSSIAEHNKYGTLGIFHCILNFYLYLFIPLCRIL